VIASTNVLFFREPDGRCPVLEWLEELRRMDPRAFAKCAAVIDRLRALGHELRRPTADFLRDGIYELRARKGHVNYRLLCFIHGRGVAVLAHSLTKEDAIPDSELREGAEPEAHL
jgi:phage-related protein